VFPISVGPSTRAYCGEKSLNQQYVALLNAIAVGWPDGAGGLALETAGGEEHMSLKNGSAVK
jgi:hypothetical protein